MTQEEMPKPPKRRYNSTRRQAQALATRRQIVEAARRLFVARGYAGATMEAIAQEAGVAVETVYAAFGTKRAVLARLVGDAVAGDDGSMPLLDQPAARDIQHMGDQRRQIREFARETRALMGRTDPVFKILRGAAPTEPEIAVLLRGLLDKRLEAMTHFVRWVAENGPLRAGLGADEAAESVWAVASPDVYHLLTDGRGWTPERYERWLGDSLVALLLP